MFFSHYLKGPSTQVQCWLKQPRCEVIYGYFVDLECMIQAFLVTQCNV